MDDLRHQKEHEYKMAQDDAIRGLVRETDRRVAKKKQVKVFKVNQRKPTRRRDESHDGMGPPEPTENPFYGDIERYLQNVVESPPVDVLWALYEDSPAHLDSKMSLACLIIEGLRARRHRLAQGRGRKPRRAEQVQLHRFQEVRAFLASYRSSRYTWRRHSASVRGTARRHNR